MGSARRTARRTCAFGRLEHPDFYRGLRHDRLDAPWVLRGPISRVRFESYVETQLAPMLNRGNVIILDNLSSHHRPKGAETLKSISAGFLFLPPYNPDLNPIEMAFAKRKVLIRKAAARTTISYGNWLDTSATSSRKRNASTTS